MNESLLRTGRSHGPSPDSDRRIFTVAPAKAPAGLPELGSVKLSTLGDATIVELRGEFDRSNLALVSAAFIGLDHERLVVVDDSRLSFIDVGAAGALMEALGRLQSLGVEVRLSGWFPMLWRIVELLWPDVAKDLRSPESFDRPPRAARHYQAARAEVRPPRGIRASDGTGGVRSAMRRRPNPVS